MATTTVKRGRRFWSWVGYWRALLEGGIVQCLIVLVWAWNTTTNIKQVNGAEITLVVVYGSISLMWTALRWRLQPDTKTFWQRLLVEIEAAALWCIELTLSVFGFMWLLGRLPVFGVSFQRQFDPYILALCGVFGVAFFGLRVGLYILQFWNRIRHTRLRWAVTHSHLMIVVIGAGIVVGIFVLLQFIFSNRQENGSMFLGIIILMLIMLVLTVITIIFVLPPSLLSSYLFTRRLSRRIERLAGATSALRAGDYSVRVEVDGQDEIARLQTDFNVMAAALEQTMHDLKAERDNVATLLQARRELIASVSHELRTPVATVRSYLESALTSWQGEQPPVTLKHDLQIMEQQVIRLQSLINDLFTLARAEVGRLEIRPGPTNVELLVERMRDTVAPDAWRRNRVEVLAEIRNGGRELPPALVDEKRLEQILQNLLHNGIRHTPPGGIVALLAYVEAGQVVLQVRDTGEGIAEEDLPRIWERFFRAGNAQIGSGSGLGLAIVKELTEAMQGRIEVESKPGEGTCFTLRFPLVKQDAASVLLENMKWMRG